ncbi:transposase domain-containing protein [Streptomyces sp. NA02950]|nr:transposase domain-containing protein [Streptomyces sp. NA02950]
MSELSGLGLLTWVYPPGLVDRVVAACGCAEQRKRLLPARLVVYFALGPALFSPAPYLEVMRHLAEGLRRQGLLGGWHVPAKSSLFRARQRLGCEPLRVLFATTAKPMATEAAPGAFWRGLRLLEVDGTCWDVADSEANEAAFGRPGNGRGPGKSAFPQMRMAALVEVGSHAVLDAELAGCRTGEVSPWSAVCHGHSARASSSWPTVSSSVSRCGRPSPPPAPICCGACPPTASCRSSSSSGTGHGSHRSGQAAALPGMSRSPSGFWPTSSRYRSRAGAAAALRRGVCRSAAAASGLAAPGGPVRRPRPVPHDVPARPGAIPGAAAGTRSPTPHFLPCEAALRQGQLEPESRDLAPRYNPALPTLSDGRSRSPSSRSFAPPHGMQTPRQWRHVTRANSGSAYELYAALQSVG